jgi:hypothetical protein
MLRKSAFFSSFFLHLGSGSNLDLDPQPWFYDTFTKRILTKRILTKRILYKTYTHCQTSAYILSNHAHYNSMKNTPRSAWPLPRRGYSGSKGSGVLKLNSGWGQRVMYCVCIPVHTLFRARFTVQFSQQAWATSYAVQSNQLFL